MVLSNIYRNGSENAILFFLGWSCDENTLKGFDIDTHDLYAVYDYTCIEVGDDFFDSLKAYRSVTIIGWSFGVWAANVFCDKLSNIKHSIAINGTTKPIDDNFGIPPKIFDLTIRNIKNRGIEMFNTRICGDDIDYFYPSKRNFESQYIELELLKTHVVIAHPEKLKWDNVIIGNKDAIFPVKNMMDFWDKSSNFARLIVDQMPHFPLGKEGATLLKELIIGKER